jgi:chromosomal replication initiation ATPase DnaA
MGDMTKLSELAQRYMKAPSAGMAEDPQAAAVRLARERRTANLAYLDLAGICLDDSDRELLASGSCETTPAIAAVLEWAGMPKTPAWLFLSGPTGTGKSIALARLATQVQCRYTGAEGLCRLFSANFGEQVMDQHRVSRCSVLLIDDVGSETDHGRMMATLLELMEVRKSRFSQPTVVTTNLSKAAFAKLYPNERLHSRLNRVQWVALTGEDRRKRK